MIKTTYFPCELWDHIKEYIFHRNLWNEERYKKCNIVLSELKSISSVSQYMAFISKYNINLSLKFITLTDLYTINNINKRTLDKNIFVINTIISLNGEDEKKIDDDMRIYIMKNLNKETPIYKDGQITGQKSYINDIIIRIRRLIVFIRNKIRSIGSNRSWTIFGTRR